MNGWIHLWGGFMGYPGQASWLNSLTFTPDKWYHALPWRHRPMTLSYELKQISILRNVLPAMLLHWEQKKGEEPLSSFSRSCFSLVRVEEGCVWFFGLSSAPFLCLSRINHCSQSSMSNPSPPLQQFLPEFSFSLTLLDHSPWHINPGDIFPLKTPLSFLQTLTAHPTPALRRILRRLVSTCCLSPSLTCLSRLLVIRKPALYRGLRRAPSCQVHSSHSSLLFWHDFSASFGIASCPFLRCHTVLLSRLPILYSCPSSTVGSSSPAHLCLSIRSWASLCLYPCSLPRFWLFFSGY